VEETQDELSRNKVSFEADKVGALWVIAKDRAPEGAYDASGDDDDGDDDDDE